MDSLLKIFFLYTLFLFSCAENEINYNSEQLESLKFELNKIRFQNPFSDSTSFYMAKDIKVDEQGRIYVLDSGDLSIKIFSNNGEKIFEFGKRGRGPGEFQGLDGIFVQDTSDIVLVFDRYLSRITEFTSNGDLKKITSIDGIVSPVIINKFRDEYIFINAEISSSIEQRKLGHIYDSNFVKQSDFLKYEELNSSAKEAFVFIQSLHGSTALVGDFFYFIPLFYDGSVYEYSVSRDVVLERVINASLFLNPYEKVKGKSNRKFDYMYKGSQVPGGELSLITKSESRGLFYYKNYFYHFILKEIEEERVFLVEILDSVWNPVGEKKIKSIPIRLGSNDTIDWYVTDMSKDGHFYINDFKNVYRLKFSTSQF